MFIRKVVKMKSIVKSLLHLVMDNYSLLEIENLEVDIL